MTTPKTYRKKPVTLEAMQWDGTARGATTIVDWILSHDGIARYWSAEDTGTTARIDIEALEGTITAFRGNYVIHDVAGEFYLCKPDIFAAIYEEVTDHE
jgi:hypothetical protein